MCASVLATGGDLVFAGAPSGDFRAFHARTGEQLWQFQTGSGNHSSPTAYSVDGRQYIAVPVGWGPGPRATYRGCSSPVTATRYSHSRCRSNQTGTRHGEYEPPPVAVDWLVSKQSLAIPGSVERVR
jgi:outer membrane protein assembly factor BamB